MDQTGTQKESIKIFAREFSAKASAGVYQYDCNMFTKVLSGILNG